MSATTDHRGLRGRRLPVTLVTAVTLALGLGACSTREPGAAALVGDRRISMQQLTDATEGLRQGNPQAAKTPDLDRTVLFGLVMAPYVLGQTEKMGVGVSDSEARAQLPGTKNPDATTVRVLRTFLALNKLQQANDPQALQAVKTEIDRVNVRLNPRFGRWNAATLQVVDRSPNWLVPAAAGAQPQPTP